MVIKDPQNLYKTTREIKWITSKLNKSGARDIGLHSIKDIKQMAKSNGEIPEILKSDKIIYLWKKKGLFTDPKNIGQEPW